MITDKKLESTGIRRSEPEKTANRDHPNTNQNKVRALKMVTIFVDTKYCFSFLSCIL